MLKIWKRIKNLWRLSEYYPAENVTGGVRGNYEVSKHLDGGGVPLKKDFPTIKKKLAIIIPPDA